MHPRAGKGTTFKDRPIEMALNITDRKRVEDELRKSEEKFRTLIETVDRTGQAMVLLKDTDQMKAACVFSNRTASAITGYGRDELARMSWMDLIDPSERKAVEDRYNRRMQGEIIDGLVKTRVLGKGNITFDIELAAVTTEFQGEKVLAVLFRNIDERRRSEEALRESEERFRLAFENANDGVCMVAPDGRLLKVNKRMCDIFGYSKEEFECMTVNDITHPEDQNISPTFIGQSISSGVESSVFEKRYFHQQGQMIYGQVSSSLVRDAKGNPMYFISHVQDITLRKQGEVERERLLSAIEQAGEMVEITDTEGTIQYVNPAFERTTGYTRDEVLGKNPRILKSGAQDEAFYKEMYQTITRGETWKGRFVNKRKDGTLYTEDATLSPVLNASKQVVSYVAVKRDMTEHLLSVKAKAELEQQFHQAQKLESVGRLAGGVAHDLNNLLSPILGFGELLLEDFGENDERKGSVKEIVDAGKRARNLVRQLLAFSRKQILEAKPIDLNRVLTQFEKLLRRTIREDIDLKIIPARSLPLIKADIGQLEQVIMNLAVNAQDAMPNGGSLNFETVVTELDEAYAALHEGVKPGPYVLLSVNDTGTGMDQETCKKIFEPFFTTKEKDKGTGLGLATVYGIVKQHGGNLRVYSEPGHGTTFKIYLPVSEETDEIKEMHALEPADLSGSETILVVEDSEQVRNLAKTVLKRKGYRVLVAENGKEALNVIEKHHGPVHLVLTDVVMPEMSGKELFHCISHRYPNVKLIYMSGYTNDVIAHKGVLDEGVHFIQKPFTVNALTAKVRKVLNQ